MPCARQGSARAPRALQQERAHHDVVIVEQAGALAIDADAARSGCQMNHHSRRWMIGIQALDVLRQAQIVLGAAGHDDIASLLRSQFFDHMPTEETGAARHNHNLFAPKRLRHAMLSQEIGHHSL